MHLTVEALPGDEDRSPAPVVLFRLGVVHQFHRLLATAEGIDLPGMLHHGGTTTWDTVGSPLRPLLDFVVVDTGRIPVAACTRMLPRLAEVAEHWRETGLAGTGYDQSPEWWQARLHQTVEELLAVLRRAVADDRDVVLVDWSPDDRDAADWPDRPRQPGRRRPSRPGRSATDVPDTGTDEDLAPRPGHHRHRDRRVTGLGR